MIIERRALESFSATACEAGRDFDLGSIFDFESGLRFAFASTARTEITASQASPKVPVSMRPDGASAPRFPGVPVSGRTSRPWIAPEVAAHPDRTLTAIRSPASPRWDEMIE